MAKINGVKCRALKVGEYIRATDIFNDGHEVEKYFVGTKMEYADKKYYQVYRKVNAKKVSNGQKSLG